MWILSRLVEVAAAEDAWHCGFHHDPRVTRAINVTTANVEKRPSERSPTNKSIESIESSEADKGLGEFHPTCALRPRVLSRQQSTLVLLGDRIFHFLEGVIAVQPWLDFWASPATWKRAL